ncbi:MAG: hypothetical protein HRT92_02310 [Piscirickettsiaceae bacterium]|nr:hypothetical protein [Piscirickettsiaceae bacterium]
MKKLILAPLLVLTMPVLADHPTVAFGNEASGPIVTIAAATMQRNTWAAGIRTEVIENDEFSDLELANYADQGINGVHSVDRIINTSLAVGYGVTDDLTVGVRLPYVERKNIREGEIEDGEAEAHAHGDSSGLGDLLLFGQYRVFETVSTDITLHLGIKAPTGKTDDKDDAGHRFETEFQPGTGSWDYLIGGAISHVNDKFGYHANVLFNKTNEGSQSTEIGDILSYNFAMTYQLNSEDHSEHNHVHHRNADSAKIKWDAVIELNGETRRKNKIGGLSEQHSGGTALFVSPGLRVTAGKFGGFISIALPVIENMNGKQTDIDARVVAGFSLSL